MCCARPGPLHCARSAWSPAAPTKSVPICLSGKPVLGDIKYGNRKMNERTGTKTQALCAVRITFREIPEENTLHDLSGKVIKLKDPQIVKQFDALDKTKPDPAKGE